MKWVLVDWVWVAGMGKEQEWRRPTAYMLIFRANSLLLLLSRSPSIAINWESSRSPSPLIACSRTPPLSALVSVHDMQQEGRVWKD